ncbi:MAG: hypothetical protein K6T78_08060 [Alicyclobacillus sp.]|nr:hypothetical protein [Alicyclobacillus sp.]
MEQGQEIQVDATYVKGTRKRTVLGFSRYFVVYATKTRTAYEAIWKFQEWMKGATVEQSQKPVQSMSEV